jgi:hypothetical protein
MNFIFFLISGWMIMSNYHGLSFEEGGEGMWLFEGDNLYGCVSPRSTRTMIRDDSRLFFPYDSCLFFGMR